MGKQLANKIRGINPQTGGGVLLLLAFLFSFVCLSMPQPADAAVAALTGNGWRTTSGTAITATTYFRGTTTVPGATNAYTIGAGANRLLVVALTINTSAAQNTRIPTVKYGLAGSENQTLQVATSDQATSSRQHTWLFYLKEAGIAAANGTNLSFTYTGTVPTYTGTYANAAVFTGVDQTTPFLTPTTYNSAATANTTVGPLGTSQVVATGNMAVEMVNILRTGSSTAPTLTSDASPAAWTLTANTTRTGTTPAAYAMRATIASITTAGTHDSTHTSSASVLDSMSAMTLKAGGVTVTNGSTVTAPSPGVYANNKNVVVDAFALGGSGTVTAITVTGNAGATSANVDAMRIYRKVGANLTALEGSDVPIGSGVPNGTTPVSVTLTATETISATTNYIIVYDINPNAVANGTGVTVSGAVSALTPAQVSLTDTGTAATILATTTLGNGTEPANARLWKSSALTNLDAFTLKHNGTSPTDDDTISNVTVVMSPTYISGGSGGTISKIKQMQVVSADGLTVYGTVTAATTADTWNIPTTGLTVTSTAANYYVRIATADVITPSLADTSGNITGFYSPITGTVTALTHSRSANYLALGDSGSASLSIDVEKPNGPDTFTAATGAQGGEINLSWTGGADLNGGALAAAPFIIRRSQPDGTAPNPGCVDGTVLPDQAGNSLTDTGLIDTNPTRYYYRVCVKDALGNISDGMTKYANAKVINICNTTPTVTLTGEDLLSTSQVVKSVNTAPFKLLISNNDIGTCPDAGFVAALTNEVAPANFDKKVGATEAAAVPFPATITLGTGGAGAPTGKTLNVYITGRPEANQLEVYKFAIQVTEAGHGTPPVTAQMTAMLNDMPPIVHNSSNMGKFQYGNWGQTYTCATCHSNSTTNIKGIYQLISTPIGRRNVVFTKTSSVDSDYTGVYGNDFRTQNNTSTNVCEVCHHQTRQHQYSASKPFGGPGNDEAYTNDHHNSRDCVRCHTHNTAFRSIYGLCGDCHGFKGTGYSPVGKNTMVKDLTNSLGPNPPNYGAHQRHNIAKLTCAACHNNTNHGLLTTAWSGNNALEIGFLASKDTYQGFNPNATVTGGTFYGTDNLNAPFYWSAGPGTTIVTVGDYNASCNTYCHGTWTGNAPSVAPIWVGTGQVVCGTCHNATGAVPPNSGSHAKHAANSGAGLGIACNKCHATYATYTGSAHINGKVEWDLSVAYPGATYNGTANNLAGSSTYSTCSNLYCHSNVQGAGGTGGPTSYATPKWGDVTTAACGSCHIVPNNTGSHANHENAEVAFDCHVCHNTGGTTSPLNHANGKIDFRFNGLGQNTRYMGISSGSITPGTAYGTCSNSDCHGRFNRAWGTTSSGLTMCEKCHGSATSARGFYNTRGPSGTLSVYSTGVGVHDIHIQNLNSPRKTTFNRYTSYAVGFKCNQCHNVPTGPFTAGHIDTTLPAEVPFSHSSSIAHKGDVYGYYSTPTYNFGTQACSNIWCHGAGMNSNRGTGSYAGTTPPVRTNPKWNVPYLTGNGSTDCTKCHALPPAAPDASYTHFGKTLNSCVSCHQHLTNDAHGFKDKSLHVNGKIDGGCDGCHGNPPTTNVVGATDGLATPAQNALNGGAGAHALHVNLPAIGNNCNNCHNSSDPAMPSNNLEIGFNALNGQVTTGTFTGYTNSVNGPKWKSSSAGTSIVKSNVKAAVCSNLYCHGGGTTTLPVLGGGADIAPNWEGIKVCGDCHGVGTTNLTVPTGGSHLRHASADNGGRGLSCDVCHGAVADNGTHVDGAVAINLDRSIPGLGANATYNINLNNYSTVTLPGLAPHASYGTCSVYCHSTVQGTNGIGAGTFTNPTWGGAALNCASCHKNMASDATGTGSHPGHAITSGYTCGNCHHDGGSGTTTHADGAIYVNFTSTVGGTYANNGRLAGSAAGYGTCSATACHGTLSPTWGNNTAKPRCEKCHGFRNPLSSSWNALDGSTGNTNAKVGAHFNHITSNSVAPKLAKTFSCRECHSDSIANSTDSVASVNHMNNAGTGKVKFGTLAGGTAAYATSTCSNVYCHGATLSGAAGRTNPVWNTPFLTGVASNDCTKCHGYPPQISAHIKTQPSTYYGPTECVNCHKHVNANGDGFTDPSLHINGNIEGGDCLSCHASVQGKRAAVVGQFASQSHHIQGSETLTTVQCYKCHWEANSDGSINALYHDKAQSANAGVSLVVWNGTIRPTTATMGTTYISYTANGSRAQISKLNFVCLGCHNTANQAIFPFGKYSTHRYSPEARLATAKPKTSIQSRYSSTRTVAWSNYAFTNSSGNTAQYGTNEKKKITKALSAHGNATKNQFPLWDASANGKGEDETMADAAASATLSNNRNVFCYDCHNSHGSDAAGITSSYSSATGRYKGGLLKSTVANQGGYTVTYKPAERTIYYKNYSTTATTSALFNSGASICNDCHNNDTRKISITRPWSITGTYSSTKAIVGYWSTPYFDNYTFSSVKRTSYKRGSDTIGSIKDQRKPMGGHYGSSVSVTMGGSAGHTGEINGLCTPCHDPHGVSNALGADRDHGVPLLKGTWVTSPYREDKADVAVKRGGGSNFGGFAGAGAAPGYHIDQNTLLAQPALVSGGAGVATAKSNRRTQNFRGFSSNALGLHNEKTPAVFAGLCLECHNQTALTGAGAATTTQAWMSKERVHQTVAGWGPTNGTNVNNTVHAYTCSKCHAPHVSRLPRLMVTNCLDVRHFQQRVSGGVISTTSGTTSASYGNMAQTTLTSSALGAGRFPGGGTRYSGTPNTAQNPGGWWFQSNVGGTQPTVQTFGSNCHNAAGAGGAAYDPTKQIWNKKTRW